MNAVVTPPKNYSRRQLLQYMASIPMLPIAGASLGTLLAGCNSNSSVSLVSASFVGMDAPSLANPAEMATTTVKSMLNLTLSDNTTRNYKLAYQPFFITGSSVSDGKGGSILAGGYYDINNKPIMDTSVTGKVRQFFSDSPDGTSLLTVAGASAAALGVKGNPVFAVVQFEYASWAQDELTDMYGKLPSPIAVLIPIP